MGMKEQFYAMVNEYLTSPEFKANYGDLFKGDKRGSGHGKFLSVLYWYALELNKPKKLDGEYVDKLYIMPYRIKQDDVDNAINVENAKKVFNEKGERVFPTADTTTGNFQKLPDMEFQIVFIQHETVVKGHAGPGEMTEYNEGDDLDKKYGVVNLDKSYVFKKNWRVPAIGGEDENEEYRLNELMDKAMQILGE